jgi:DNA-directed RNA polymerase subunit K/omega
MIHRPREGNSFEFVRVSTLRAAQLMRGCTARVPAGIRAIVTAQREVAAGKVEALAREPDDRRAVPLS